MKTRLSIHWALVVQEIGLKDKELAAQAGCTRAMISYIRNGKARDVSHKLGTRLLQIHFEATGASAYPRSAAGKTVETPP